MPTPTTPQDIARATYSKALAQTGLVCQKQWEAQS